MWRIEIEHQIVIQEYALTTNMIYLANTRQEYLQIDGDLDILWHNVKTFNQFFVLIVFDSL